MKSNSNKYRLSNKSVINVLSCRYNERSYLSALSRCLNRSDEKSFDNQLLCTNVMIYRERSVKEEIARF